MKHLGSLGHICPDEDHEFFRANGAIADDRVRGARDISILEQMRELLLAE